MVPKRWSSAYLSVWPDQGPAAALRPHIFKMGSFGYNSLNWIILASCHGLMILRCFMHNLGINIIKLSSYVAIPV